MLKLKYMLPTAAVVAALTLSIGLALLTGQPVKGSAALRPVAPPTWGPDIQVNPPVTSTPDVQVNYALAINPLNPNLVVAGYDSAAPNSNSGYARSTDAGRTWNGGRFYGPWISDTQPVGNTGVGFDGQGTAFYTTQVRGANATGYVVLTSTTGSAWSNPNPVVLSDNSQYRSQAALAVDPRAGGPFAGSLYLAWNYFTTEDQGIWLRYSRDQGHTWSADVPVSDAGNEAGEQPSVVTASDGSVYIGFGAEDTDLWLDHSTDGGANWGTDQAITGAPITPIGGLDAENRELLLLGSGPDDGVVINNDPRIAVAPQDPRTVYAVWNDGRWESGFTIYGHAGQHADIAFSRSTDAGATWSAPLRINDDALANGVDQWAPSIASGPDGRIGVTWYDRRDDPQHLLYDLYYTESTDGGLSWSANTRVSSTLNSATAVYNGDGNGALGDYRALVYGPDYVLPSWVDSRGGHTQDFYINRGIFVPATPTAQPTAPPTGTAIAPPTGTPTARPTSPPSSTPTVLPSTTPTASPALTPSATPCALSFSDVPPDAYFAPAVSWLACQGILSGYADGTFRPYNTTTRGQLVKLVVNGFGWPLATPAAPTFADVPSAQPFYPFIETALAHGVIDGYSCGGAGEPCPGRYFRPGADVTRGQLAKIVVNARGWAPLFPPAPTFADVPAGDAFFGFVERAAAQNVLSGYSCGGAGEPCPGRYFRPVAASTRGQLAKILYNVLTQP